MIKIIKQVLKKILKRVLRAVSPRLRQKLVVYCTEPTVGYNKNLLYETDPEFTTLYDASLARTGTPDAGQKRRERFYNLLHLSRQTYHLDGAMIECGCWKGLSSLMLMTDLQRHDPSFHGHNYWICDSFQGLSEPTSRDRINDEKVGVQIGGASGDFDADIEQVRANLSDFPAAQFHPGWLPQSLAHLPEHTYRWVHLDLDFYEPIKGTVEYFYPRLVPGGVLVCDDYGSLFWPGAKSAIDDYCRAHDIRPLPLSTGQVALWKRQASTSDY